MDYTKGLEFSSGFDSMIDSNHELPLIIFVVAIM
jgi:hypothetical protein